MPAPSVVDEWLEADGLILIESWARDGYTVEDIATRIGVTVGAFRSWMSKYEEIRKAVKDGRELVDYKVENALLKAALGYTTKETKVTTHLVGGKVVESFEETVTKEAAPNVRAATYWLGNRLPKKWRNLNGQSSILSELDEDTSVHITIERAESPQSEHARDYKRDEVDPEWQEDVNRHVVLRGATEQEKAEVQERAKQEKRREAEEQEKFLQMLPSDDTVKPVKGKKKAQNEKHITQDKTDAKRAPAEDDPDYWPDDWEDED